jgi:hypothetical protein
VIGDYNLAFVTSGLLAFVATGIVCFIRETQKCWYFRDSITAQFLSREIVRIDLDDS